jgi:hypothetical protein
VIKHAEHADRCGERSDNAIRSQSRKSGSAANYLVGVGIATRRCVTETSPTLADSADLPRIPLANPVGQRQSARR